MVKYIFILGRNWRLALAELDIMLRTDEFKGYITDYSANAAIVEFEEENEDKLNSLVADLMVRLGSVQKIGKVSEFIEEEMFHNAFPETLQDVDKKTNENARKYLEEIIYDLCEEVFDDIKGKKAFVANSIYPVALNDSYYKVLIKHFLPFVNSATTHSLKKLGAKSAIYFKYPQKQIEKGTLNPIFPHHFFRYELYKPNKAEILYCLTEEGLYIGRTYTVVDSNFQKMIDENRPYRDFRQTIPPKFGKTLLSFLGLESPLGNKKILDPFCGFGTILQFAFIQGFDIYGSDINQRHIDATRANLRFTAEAIGRNIDDSYLNEHIIKADIGRLDGFFKPESFDGIATEPLLFPYFRDFPSIKEVKRIMNSEIVEIYSNLFVAAYKLLKKNRRLACTVPVITIKGEKIAIPAQNLAEKAGFTVMKLLNSERIFDSDRESLAISSYKFPSVIDMGTKKLAREFYLFLKKD